MGKRLDEIEERLRQATKGAWWVQNLAAPKMSGHEPDVPTFKIKMNMPDGRLNSGPGYTHATAELIAHAPADLAALAQLARAVEDEHDPLTCMADCGICAAMSDLEAEPS